MNSLTRISTIGLAALALAVPVTAFAGNHKGSCYSGGGYYGSRGGTAVYVSGGGRGCYGGGYGYGYRPYCAPVAAYRPYCAPRPYFYGGPAISVGFSTYPAYYGSAGYYDSYPTRAVYRGVAVGGYGYRDSGSYGDDLAVDVQRALARRGYYRGSIDGDVGPGTRAAIRAFQYNRGLTVTGRIDGSLVRSLGLS